MALPVEPNHMLNRHCRHARYHLVCIP